MWRNKEYFAKIQAALDQVGGVCQRCVLRFAGVKSSFEHNKIKKCVVNGVDNCGEPEAKKAKTEGQLCRACCGVLQEECMDKILDVLCQEIHDSDYVTDHFMVAISLPVSLTLRNHSILVLLDEKVEGFDEDEVPPIKQVWKWIFSPKIEKKLQKTLVSGDKCDFYAELQLDSTSDQSELECL